MQNSTTIEKLTEIKAVLPRLAEIWIRHLRKSIIGTIALNTALCSSDVFQQELQNVVEDNLLAILYQLTLLQNVPNVHVAEVMQGLAMHGGKAGQVINSLTKPRIQGQSLDPCINASLGIALRHLSIGYLQAFSNTVQTHDEHLEFAQHSHMLDSIFNG